MSENRFSDVAAYDQLVANAINCLGAYGITEGTSATTYTPGRAVYRWEMALFLDRLITYADAGSDDLSFPDDESSAGFDDLGGVPTAGVEAINRIANLGVAQGFDADTYGPYRPVLRKQMASFLDRIQDAIAGQAGGEFTYEATEADTSFSDVPLSHPQFEDIYSLQSVGIVQGVGDGTFAPDVAVTRAQMALFLLRHLDENIDSGLVASLAEEVAAPTFTVSEVPAGTTTVVFTASEPLYAPSVSLDDFTETSAAAIAGVVTEGDTITVTFDAALDQGDVVTLEADSVQTLLGVSGPDADVSATVPTAPDGTPPAVTAGAVTAGATEVVFTADENLDAGTVVAGDFTETSAADITDVAVDGGTITVTFGAALAAGDEITLTADSIADVAGDTGPAADVSVTVGAATGDTEAPEVTDLEAGAAGSTTIVITFSEDITDNTLSPGDISVNGTDLTATDVASEAVENVGGIDVGTITLVDPLSTGDVVVFKQGNASTGAGVTDLAGNRGPAADVEVTVP